MMLVEVTAPAAEALPVAMLRDHLRLGTGFGMAEDAAETAALAGFLRAAIATVEARTGKVLLARRFRLRLEAWRDPEGQPLPLAPVEAVERVETADATGVSVVVDAGLYRLVPDMQRPVLAPVGAFLPAVPLGGFAEITLRAGFGAEWAQVPADLAQAVLLLAARYHEDRSFAGSAGALPFGVGALIEPWRSVRVLGGAATRAAGHEPAAADGAAGGGIPGPGARRDGRVPPGLAGGRAPLGRDAVGRGGGAHRRGGGAERRDLADHRQGGAGGRCPPPAPRAAAAAGRGRDGAPVPHRGGGRERCRRPLAGLHRQRGGGA